jgi:hypothetical protein
MQPAAQTPLHTVESVGLAHVFWHPFAPHWLYSSLGFRHVGLGLANSAADWEKKLF